MDDAKAQMDMMARCLAFARENAATFEQRKASAEELAAQEAAVLKQALDAEEAQRLALERDRKKREREAADAELARIHQENMTAVDTWRTQQDYKEQNRDEINKLAEQTADDCLMLLERNKKRSPSVQQVHRPAQPSGASGGVGDAAASKTGRRSPSVGAHQARMDARRANRMRRSRSNSRSYRRPPAQRGDAPRVPRRLMYSNDVSNNRRPFQENSGRSQQQRSRSRSNRHRGRGGRNERRRSNSRRSSSSSSEGRRKDALKKRMRQWESKATGHLWS